MKNSVDFDMCKTPLTLREETIGHDANRAIYFQQSKATKNKVVAPPPRVGPLDLPAFEVAPLPPLDPWGYLRFRLRQLRSVMTMGAL